MILVRFAGAMLHPRSGEACFALKGSKHGTRLRINWDSYYKRNARLGTPDRRLKSLLCHSLDFVFSLNQSSGHGTASADGGFDEDGAE